MKSINTVFTFALSGDRIGVVEFWEAMKHASVKLHSGRRLLTGSILLPDRDCNNVKDAKRVLTQFLKSRGEV